MSIVSGADDISVFSKFQELVRGWMPETGATRVDIEYNVIALTGDVMTWIMVDGERKSVHLPSDLSFTMYDIRPAQADPRRGAWLYSHFWMEASDGVLHQECDWMREPVIGGEPVGDGDAAFELDQFPRDPQWVPEWMAVKAAAYHKEAERRERRRQRDRERRARKKAEAAQAEGNGAGEPGSGRVGRSGDE
nr:hypothetical protein [Actinomyces oris]